MGRFWERSISAFSAGSGRSSTDVNSFARHRWRLIQHRLFLFKDKDTTLIQHTIKLSTNLRIPIHTGSNSNTHSSQSIKDSQCIKDSQSIKDSSSHSQDIKASHTSNEWL